jgi:hypothetical protein
VVVAASFYRAYRRSQAVEDHHGAPDAAAVISQA